MVPISTELILKTIVLQWLQTGVFFVNTRQKASKTSVFDAFCCKNAEKCVGQNVGQLPDPHRDPHARKKPKSTGEEIVSFPVLCLPAGLIESAP